MSKLFILITLSILTTIVEAEEFETLYLSCTLTKEKVNGVTNPIPLRNAKTRDLHEVYIRVSETKIGTYHSGIFSYNYGLKYTSSSNNIDIYSLYNETVYFDTENHNLQRILIADENKIRHGEAKDQIFECKNRQATIKEKAETLAEELKDKWFPDIR